MIKKDDSSSSPNSMRQSHSEHLRSPTRENSLSRQSSKTPVNLTSSGDHRENNSSEVNTVNNSNANSSSKMSSSSPISLSEKSNHHNENASSNGINSIGNNNNHRDHFSMNGPEKILPSPSTDRKDFEFSKVNGELMKL